MLLNCHSCYSLRYGILSVDELLDDIQKSGYHRFVLSDINTTSACLETVRQCAERKLHPILGIDFRNGIQPRYIGIAQNNKGFYDLNKHLSYHLHHNELFSSIAPDFKNAFVVYQFAVYSGFPLRENEFIGVTPQDITKLPFSKYKHLTKKMVVLQPVTFRNKVHHNAHRLLRAIDKNIVLSKLNVSEQTSPNEMMPPNGELQKMFSQFPEIIANTEYILNSCSINFHYDSFGKTQHKNLAHYTGTEEGDRQLLRKESYDGIFYRYGNSPSQEVMERIEKELQVISQMGFASYFLINWDIVKYARHKNYFYVGRGSGANSMLAYLLRITDVDPIDLDLYFERFINPFRTSPPDFDIDFSWLDRDDITKYIFNRFGYERTALLGAYNTFQHDAVIRELGKVFGLPAHEIEKTQRISWQDADNMQKLVLKYSKLIKGLPNHLSIHSSGILISEKPMYEYTATFMPPKGFPTTQFSMLEAEDIGLYKFDILSQRGIAKIKDATEIIRKNTNTDIDIHDIPKFKNDAQVRKLLSQGKAIGCFYIESPAMRMLLSKLRADDYKRLVAASSIIRPGVSKSGMMREYIVRYRNEKLREKAKNEIPELYAILEETYGVMVYQEDVIKVAHNFAGLSLAESDYLRRGMSWKFKQRNEFWRVKEQFFSNCRTKGYSEKTINDIWTQIESFANYAFSKGHSASYAVESYQALFLKAYFPLEYMVATLNNGGGFYRKELYLHEARMHGAKIELPCVNKSNALFEIYGDTIYIGLGVIAGCEAAVMKNIVDERNANGEYKSLSDFIERVPVSIEQIRLLIRAGAFRFTGENRKKILWDAHALINPMKKIKTREELFEIETKNFKLPKLQDSPLEMAFDEIELLGFSLCSPFKLLRDEIPSKLTSRQLSGYIGKTVTIAGYLITTKPTGTSKGERMYFGTFLDCEGNWIDTVHFPPSARAYPFTGPGCYKLTGKVVEEFDFLMIEVSEQKRLAVIDREKIDNNILVPKAFGRNFNTEST
jgi:DNA polymerase-3 subunit alpha